MKKQVNEQINVKNAVAKISPIAGKNAVIQPKKQLEVENIQKTLVSLNGMKLEDAKIVLVYRENDFLDYVSRRVDLYCMQQGLCKVTIPEGTTELSHGDIRKLGDAINTINRNVVENGARVIYDDTMERLLFYYAKNCANTLALDERFMKEIYSGCAVKKKYKGSIISTEEIFSGGLISSESGGIEIYMKECIRVTREIAAYAKERGVDYLIVVLGRDRGCAEAITAHGFPPVDMLRYGFGRRGPSSERQNAKAIHSAFDFIKDNAEQAGLTVLPAFIDADGKFIVLKNMESIQIRYLDKRNPYHYFKVIKASEIINNIDISKRAVLADRHLTKEIKHQGRVLFYMHEDFWISEGYASLSSSYRRPTDGIDKLIKQALALGEDAETA